MSKISEYVDDVFYAIRRCLIGNYDGEQLKEEVLGAYGLLVLARVALSQEQQGSGGDFAVQLPSIQVWDEAKQCYTMAPARTLYFIGEFITESKIYAIKQLRTRSQSRGGDMGLREAKDIVDAMADSPRPLNQWEDRR